MKIFARPIILTISLLILLTSCMSDRKYHEEEINAFLDNIDAFQHVNALIINYITNNKIEADNFVVWYNEDGVTIELYPYTDSLSVDDVDSLSRINDIPYFRLDFISYYGNRISYGGDGSRVFVYMEDDRAPSFFWDPDDGIRFKCYKICDNWYLLYHHFAR